VPIIGITDRGAAFPRLGTLRKGGPKVSDRQPGTDLKDHFRFDSDDQEATATFAAAYGDRPNGIRVMFYYKTAAENFETWQEHHSAGALKHRCDGQAAILWLDKDGTYHHEPIPCPSIALKASDPKIDKKHLCRPVGRLKVIIPELKRMAYVLVATTSINDILELQGNLEAAEAMRGDLRGIPFVLTRRARKISAPGDNGTRRRMDKWLLSLEPASDWVRLQLTAVQQAALPSPALALPAAGASYVDPDTGEIFAADDDEDEELPPIAPPAAEPEAPAMTELVTIDGMASRVKPWFTDSGDPRLMARIGETIVIARGPLAETWHDLADGELVTIGGAWAAHKQMGRYLAVSAIERAAKPDMQETADLPL
jgi:hypothetical protein